MPDLLKSFYDSVNRAKAFDDYKDLQNRKENYIKITEYEKKVEFKRKEIEKYMNSIDEKSNVIMGFSQPQ